VSRKPSAVAGLGVAGGVSATPDCPGAKNSRIHIVVAVAYFVVISDQGPAWIDSEPMREQRDWAGHAVFMNALAEFLHTNEQVVRLRVREGLIPAHRNSGDRKFTFLPHEIFDSLINNRYELG
jgi:hypothetical protein